MPVRRALRPVAARDAARCARAGAGARAAPAPRYDEWLELAAATSCARSTRPAPTARPEHLALLPRARRRRLGAAAHAGVRRLAEHPRAAPGVPGPGAAGDAGTAPRARRSPPRAPRSTAGCATRYAAHGAVPLDAARVLDFGCGWGRLTRMLARDVAPGNLYGCDPAQAHPGRLPRDRVPAELARSDVPARADPVRRAVRPRVRVLRVHPPVRAGAGGAASTRCTPRCGPAASSSSRSGRRPTCAGEAPAAGARLGRLRVRPAPGRARATRSGAAAR